MGSEGEHSIDLRRHGVVPPPVTAAQVRGWFAAPGRAHVLQAELQQVLESPPAGSHPLEPRLKGLLRHRARLDRPLMVDLAFRERQGGRRYLYTTDAAGRGFKLVGRCPGGDRLHLQSIPRWVRRRVISAPSGRTFVLGDMQCAFPSFLASLADDDALRHDIASGDIHQAVADGIGTSRDIGKTLNNTLIGLAGVRGLSQNLREAGALESIVDQAGALRERWWARWSRAARFRDDVEHRVEDAARSRSAFKVIAPDGRTFSFSPAEVRGVQFSTRKAVSFLTIFSSLLRCIEGVLLDQATRDIMSSPLLPDVRLFITMYDGLLVTVPEEAEGDAKSVVHEALERAGNYYGYPVRARSWASRSWSDGR